MSTSSAIVEFRPPAPGGWMRLADHFPGALTAEYRRIYAETAPAGMAAYLARYGVVARTIDVAFVHGHLYIAPVPLAGPREMRRTPPGVAVWLLARLHPAYRRRTRAAQRALAERPWRAAAAHWFSTEPAQWIQRNAALETTDPTDLSNEDLLGHLVACRQLAVDGYRRHFELHGDDLLPIGLLLARCGEWGVQPDVAAQALRGAPAPSTVPEPVEPAWQLLSGYDLDARARCEMARRADRRPVPAGAPRDLRLLVAADHHDELERLLDDARAAVPLRDDNGMVTGAWPMGLLRRAMLECGRRLGLDDPTLAVEATVDELVSWVRGDGPSVGPELGRRRDARIEDSRLDAPLRLGPELALPPLTALPRALALIASAQLASAEHMIGQANGPIGIGDTVHTGRALVVDDPGHALELIEPGDVVVTDFTCPSWNAVLACAGAIVTTTGGSLSHAAILARELGIPAVLGDATATTRLATGRMVTVDPVRACVTGD